MSVRVSPWYGLLVLLMPVASPFLSHLLSLSCKLVACASDSIRCATYVRLRPVNWYVWLFADLLKPRDVLLQSTAWMALRVILIVCSPSRICVAVLVPDAEGYMRKLHLMRWGVWLYEVYSFCRSPRWILMSLTGVLLGCRKIAI